jgi:hypothetical protein
MSHLRLHSGPHPPSPQRASRYLLILVLGTGLAGACLLHAAARGQASTGGGQSPRPALSVVQGADGRLVYTSDAAGNRIVDFSHAGYGGGGRAIPDVAVRVVVEPGTGSDRQRLQAAIDVVSAMPRGDDGFRGAVLVERGVYRVDGALRLAASGVVLRGQGPWDEGTVLIAQGTSRRALLTAAGTGGRAEVAGSRRAISADYVPAGSRTIPLGVTTGLAVGDRVVVTRPSTKEWIAALGMNLFQGWRPENRLHWQPGSRDISWERIVAAVGSDSVTLDAPLTTALEARFGGGTLARVEFTGRIEKVGIENLALVSSYDSNRPADEDHAWIAVALDRIEHAWVRRVAARHFAGSAVDIGADARAITVEDVESVAPVSEVAGYRRRAFFTSGQLTLFRRCRSERGRHDFGVGITAAGPNVFLESSSREALDFSGPLESWASGVLYDNVVIRGNALRLTNRGTADQGQGWAAANSVLWNSEATDVEVQSPPGAVNQAYGCKGLVAGDGIVWDPRTTPFRDFYRGSAVEPRSLYLAQLAERLGLRAIDAVASRPVPTSPQDARRLTASEIETFATRERAAASQPGPGPLTLERGAFTIGGRTAWTARVGYSWFQGQMVPALARTFGPAITRFAPGRVGVGLTDDLEAMAAAMPPRAAFYQHYGLWYDRRRVDHNYYGSPEQRTADAWAPFMELPWARSGIGKAWDGLSKYDLMRFNAWYFDRMKAFADIADRRGLVLYHNFYFQHWLLESRSHYVDFPWRPTNAIQDTGMPDEVPAANVFYDMTDPFRRNLHRRYIRHALDVLGANTNVVHGIDREYTGSIEFVRFWLDTIAEWQAEHRKTVFVSLEIPKDQLDNVLRDPVRGRLVSAIDILGWTYRADGSLFASRGAINRAPREQRPDIATQGEVVALKQKLGGAALDQRDFLNGPEFQTLFDSLWTGSKAMKYRAWREYRDAFPRVVTLWSADEFPALTRAVEAGVPAAAREGTAGSDLVVSPRESAWCVARPGQVYLVYSVEGRAAALDLSKTTGQFTLTWVDGATGAVTRAAEPVASGRVVTLTPPRAGRPWAAWLSR